MTDVPSGNDNAILEAFEEGRLSFSDLLGDDDPDDES